MINLKKATFAFFVGLGLTSAATSTLAAPDICTCLDWKIECNAGNIQSCTKFSNYRCYYYNYDQSANDFCGY